jgi:hypothetical protein
MKQVPLIPTPAMIAAAYGVVNDQRTAFGIRRIGKGFAVREIYQAMINAAPTEGGN